MTVQKIKIIKSNLEKLFDKIAPNWKKQPLYQWQYGGDNQSSFGPKDAYDLEKCQKIKEGIMTIYFREGEFIFERKGLGEFMHVLTNVAPSEDYEKRESKEVTINELKFLWD